MSKLIHFKNSSFPMKMQVLKSATNVSLVQKDMNVIND